MPGARIEALRSIARAASSDPQLFERGPTLDDTIGRLRAIRGVGDWTAHYIAMRACGEPDAFPASDVGLLRGAADEDGRRPTPAELLERAGRWRPWRAYAAHWLWARDAEAGERAARGQGSSIASRRVRSNAPAQTGIWEPPAPDGQTEFNRKRRSAPDRSRRR
jgi:3-methyladenine DNA glycosylase/8-oxoguanine DNA glycosylase